VKALAKNVSNVGLGRAQRLGNLGAHVECLGSVDDQHVDRVRRPTYRDEAMVEHALAYRSEPLRHVTGVVGEQLIEQYGRPVPNIGGRGIVRLVEQAVEREREDPSAERRNRILFDKLKLPKR
jgi:hypothetical protein